MTPFTKIRAASVASQGERRLITAIRGWLGRASPRSPFGIGDDCAVLPPSRRAQLVTTDPVIYGQHFDAAVPPRAVGAKLLKRNLSDIAAMGGRPGAAVISLALAPDTRLDWLQEFYLGLAACARRHRVKIVGGDITQAPANFFGAFLTLYGEATARRIVSRAGSRAGDRIFVTGELGGSLLGHHHAFTPRLAEGAWLARRAEVRAMMDVSDGLAKDLHALTPQGAEPALEAQALPRRTGADVRGALADGEDYELVFALASHADRAAFERAWAHAFPRTRLTCIGRFVRAGKRPPGAINLAEYRGYEHLARSRS